MLYFGTDNPNQYATVWKIENRGTYSLVNLSTSRSDKKNDDRLYSNWSFCRFVGEAHETIGELSERDRILVRGGISKEPYTKDGVKKYPENPQVVIFHWEKAPAFSGESSRMDQAPVVEDEDGDIPF